MLFWISKYGWHIMNPWIRRLQKYSGKDEASITEIWNKAKKEFSKTANIIEADFTDKHYKRVYDKVMSSLVQHSKKVRPVDFIESEKSAKDFIHELVVSNDFDIPSPLVFSSKEKDQSEAEEDEASGLDMEFSQPDGAYASSFDDPQEQLPDSEGRDDGDPNSDWNPIGDYYDEDYNGNEFPLK